MRRAFRLLGFVLLAGVLLTPALAGGAVALGAVAAAPHYHVLHTFAGSPDGAEPYAGLTMDAGGDLYGTTYRGGAEGTVFRLTPGLHGLWTERILFDFSNPSVSGGFPLGDVAVDANRNVYGTAGPGAFNNGVVFELRHAPSSVALWNVDVLHTFKGDGDGIQPFAGVVFDTAGNLYGDTVASGPIGGSCGTVYQLTPANGTWVENLLHIFTCKPDGSFPSADLVFDSAGNLYGTTQHGGIGCRNVGCGQVFELAYNGGTWVKSTIYNFKDGADGIQPNSALVFDKAGNLYGTTAVGGTGPCVIEGIAGCGTVFELTRQPSGWKKTVIYRPDGTSGGGLFGGVVFDDAGNLYGTMSFYGIVGPSCAAGCGSVFKLTPQGRLWRPTTLYAFMGGADGGEPFDRLLVTPGGIYGTTIYGGSSAYPCQIQGCGVVFEITP